MILKFKYRLITHPYANEESSENEIWAEIKLVIIDENSQFTKVVFDRQWDVLVFLDWISKNREALLNEKIPLKLEGFSSIAKGIFSFYKDLDPEIESEDVVESIYSYRQRHGLRFAFRGVDMDDIYIGRLNDMVTISQYSDDKNQWNFNIKADYFINDIENAIRDI